MGRFVLQQETGNLQIENKNKSRMVLFVLCLPLFILAIDNTVLNLALPSISSDLGSSASQLQWIVDAYILVFASLLLTMGAIGDRYGRKRILQVGLAMFGIGSLAAALSSSTEMLIFCRAFLGVGGSMIIPSTLSIVIDIYRDPKERAQAIAVWASVFALGAGIGPVVGGYLLEYFNWNAVFLINLPVVVITFGWGHFFIHESKGENAPKPDMPGMILSIVGLFVLVYGIIAAGEDGWGDTMVLTYLATGILVLMGFAFLENRVASPMLPLEFFRNMSFTGASVAMVLTSFSLMGSMFFLSQYFQSVQGYAPVAAAIRLLPMAVVVFITAILSAKIATRIGVKLAVGIGIFVAGMGLFYLSQVSEVDTSYPSLIVGVIILAFGIGMTTSPATDSIMGALPVSRAGIGSAMNNTTRQVGGALGVAVLGSLMNSTYLNKVNALHFMDTLSSDTADAVRSSIQAAHIAAPNLPADISEAVVDGANQAFVSGMTDAMIIGAFILWGAAVFTLSFLPSRVQSIDVIC